MQTFSESSKQRLKGELEGKVREPFAVITSIEQKRGAKLAETDLASSDLELKELCAHVKGDTGDDIDVEMMRRLVALMDRDNPGEIPAELQPQEMGGPTGGSTHLDRMAEGEFCIFTAEPAGDVELPDGGTRKAWTRDRLLAVIENHGPSGRVAQKRPELALENPVVIGHEEDSEFMRRTDTPAAAWIGSNLRMVGDRLMAPFRDMPEKVKGWVDSGMFPKRSAEFYPDYHGLGPVLRRVALLGGQIPAKKDLGETVFFGEDEPAFEVVSFREATGMTLGEMIVAASERLEVPRAELISKIAAATDVSDEVVQSWLPREFSELGDDIGAKVSAVLKGEREEAEEVTEAAPAGGEEALKMAEATKTGSKPPAAATPKDGNGAPTAEQFSEATKRIGVLEEQAALKSETIAKLRDESTRARTELDAARGKAQRQDVDTYCEQLNRRGQATGASLAKVRDYLLKCDGVEKFAEGASASSDARTLFSELLPRMEGDGRTLVTADALAEGDEVAQARAQHEAYVKRTGSDLTLEQFCEGNEIELPKQEPAKKE